MTDIRKQAEANFDALKDSRHLGCRLIIGRQGQGIVQIYIDTSSRVPANPQLQQLVMQAEGDNHATGDGNLPHKLLAGYGSRREFTEILNARSEDDGNAGFATSVAGICSPADAGLFRLSVLRHKSGRDRCMAWMYDRHDIVDGLGIGVASYECVASELPTCWGEAYLYPIPEGHPEEIAQAYRSALPHGPALVVAKVIHPDRSWIMRSVFDPGDLKAAA